MIERMLNRFVTSGGSDLHLAVGAEPIVRMHGSLIPMEGFPVLTEELLKSSAEHLVGHHAFKQLESDHELDWAIELEGGYRIRINAYYQQDSIALALRLLPNTFFKLDQLGLPMQVLEDICSLHSGLVLVTGATGSGKSTTIASLIHEINTCRACHIHTIEDPVEYRHYNKMSFVTQREVGRDTCSFAEALKRSMREDPDVVMVGEMRDLDTMSAALTLAETGHLTFATLHTSTAVQTISRIISAFPAAQQTQVRTQIASTLQYVICQKLIPWNNNAGRSLAAEVLCVTPAVRSMIRDSKTHQIATAMQTGHDLGMRTLNAALQKLVKDDLISMEEAASYSESRRTFSQENFP
ncbi:MAG: PilT/PilU family type 4a pilus ATPase [Spartobacteria bacterium]|nr:PilT/PilU family type 4a pilus ATPase [Spartobacteria bacterium]